VLSVGTVSPPSSAPGVLVPATPGWHNAIDGTNRWDAGWFERLALEGYGSDEGSAAFYPGYPLAIRALVTSTPLGAFGAATVISNIAFFGCLLVFFALTSREYSESVAKRGVVLLASFPASFFFFAPYSESLFLLFSLLAYLWARERRWAACAAAGSAAAFTRGVGVLLVPPLLVEAWSIERGAARRRALAAACAPLLAPVVYALFWLIRSGDALAPWHAQDSWHRSLLLAPITIGRAVRLAIDGVGDPRGIYWTVDLLLTAALLLPLCWRWRRLSRSSQVYVGATALLVLSYPLPARPLLSAPRFFLVCFPLLWAMALLLRGRLFIAAVGVSTVGFILLAAAFMNWGFVF
jgi:mannosyltransferase PIG-V